jgi:hypothetical protein
VSADEYPGELRGAIEGRDLMGVARIIRDHDNEEQVLFASKAHNSGARTHRSQLAARISGTPGVERCVARGAGVSQRLLGDRATHASCFAPNFVTPTTCVHAPSPSPRSSTTHAGLPLNCSRMVRTIA